MGRGTQAWREDVRGASALVFVCSGNVVRSAFAELLARHLGAPLPVRSVATTYRSQALFPETRRALDARGVAPAVIHAFRPTYLSDVAEEIEPGAVLFAMSRAHLAALERWPRLAARCHLLAAVLGAPREIADPVLEGADFEQTFALLERCVEALLREVGPSRP